MNDENPVWGAWLMAAMVVICCGGPFLIAAVGAGGLSLVAAWLEPSRVALLTAAGAFFTVSAYLNRSRLDPCCDVKGPCAKATNRVLAPMLWSGAALALCPSVSLHLERSTGSPHAP